MVYVFKPQNYYFNRFRYGKFEFSSNSAVFWNNLRWYSNIFIIILDVLCNRPLCRIYESRKHIPEARGYGKNCIRMSWRAWEQHIVCRWWRCPDYRRACRGRELMKGSDGCTICDGGCIIKTTHHWHMYEGCSKRNVSWMENENLSICRIIYWFHSFKIITIIRDTKFQSMNPTFKGIFLVLSWYTLHTLIYCRSSNLSGHISLSCQVFFNTWKKKISPREQGLVNTEDEAIHWLTQAAEIPS